MHFCSGLHKKTGERKESQSTKTHETSETDSRWAELAAQWCLAPLP